MARVNHQDLLNGTQRAHVKPENIKARSLQKNKEQVAIVCNKAFDTYYKGFRLADNVLDLATQEGRGDASKEKLWDLWHAVRSDLKNAATNALITYDLQDVFKDLEANGGDIVNESWDGWKGIFNVPSGVSSFLQTVESRGQALIQTASDWQRYQNHIEYAKMNKKWDDCKTNIERAQKLSDTWLPMLWAGYGVGVSDQYTAVAGKCFGWAGKAHGLLSKYIDFETAAAKGDAHLFARALATVVEGLPVFGTLYGGLIVKVPDMVAYFQRIARQRYEPIGLYNG